MTSNKNDLVNNALSKIKTSPGFGSRIGADPDLVQTMDYIDSDGDGVDDRNQRGPGQPYVTFEQSKNEERSRFRPGAKPRSDGSRKPKTLITDPRGRPSSKTNYAKDYMATFQQSANLRAQNPTTGQQKKTSDFGSYDPASFGGSMYNQGWGNMVNWGNKFKDNEAIQGFISGSRLDSNQTMMNMGMDLLYQKGQLSQMADYQGGMENLKTGNTLKLLAAEGGITRDLMWDQGDIKSRQIGEQGVEDRAQIKTLGSENRKTRRVEGSETRMTEMTKGDQTRKTQRDKYREDRKMRADARGAIRRTGSRFFG